MEHIKEQDSDQIRMISLGEMVEPERMIRIIDPFIEMWNMEDLWFSYFKLNKEGRSFYQPASY